MKIDFSSFPKWPLRLDGALSSLIRPFFPKKQLDERVTVCDLGRSKIILLEALKRADGSVTIEKFEHIRNTFQDQRPALLLKPFFEDKKFSKEGIRVTLKGHGVLIRFLRFPKMKVEDLGSAMQYEVEQYVPFELKDCVMDFAVVDENVKTPEGEKMEVMIAVVKRQELEPTLEVFRSLECKLSSVDVDILSAMTALEHFYPEDFAGHVGLLDIGSEISTVGIIRGRKPCFIRDISYGTYDMLKRLTSRSGLSVEDIDQLFERGEVPAPEIAAEIAGSLDGIIGELKVSFDYYRDQARHEKPIQKLFVSGGGALHPVVLKALTQGLGITAAGFEVLSKIKWADSVDAEALRRYESCLSVPIGLALRPE